MQVRRVTGFWYLGDTKISIRLAYHFPVPLIECPPSPIHLTNQVLHAFRMSKGSGARTGKHTVDKKILK